MPTMRGLKKYPVNMPIPFIMPKFDMDQEDATIATWEKGEGEFVKADQTVLVVETSKVAIDVPAPATGTLAGIRFKPGDVVPVTTVIAYILKEGETMADLCIKMATEPTPPAPTTRSTSHIGAFSTSRVTVSIRPLTKDSSGRRW